MRINQHNVPAGPARADEDAITPLDVMLDAMRWAHAEAKRACAERVKASDEKAADAFKKISSLWALALSGAKDAAPYVHMRLATSTPRDPSIKTHEEWLVELERSIAGNAGH